MFRFIGLLMLLTLSFGFGYLWENSRRTTLGKP
ncbi:MAG: hypothetical protein OJF47_001695 [Nitrospira sp.]|nr:MAG: hypothetical protein OJF47_001695 [Nitrospira sp.]